MLSFMQRYWLLRAKEIAGDSPISLLIEEDYPVIDEDEENGNETFECPVCGADVSCDAIKCPECNVVFEADKIMQQQNISSIETDSFKKHYKIGKVVLVAVVLIVVILVLINFNNISINDSSTNSYKNKSYTSPGSPSELNKLRAEIEEDKQKITDLKMQIEENEEQLQLLEMTIKRASSQSEYDQLYSEYENLYDEHLSLYDEIEILVNTTNKKVTLYNSMINNSTFGVDKMSILWNG